MVKKSQTILEYVLLVGAAMAAIFLMLAYFGRSIQGSLREGADSVGEQYSPRSMSSSITETTSANVYYKIGNITRDRIFLYTTNSSENAVFTRKGSENIVRNLSDDWW